MYRKQQRNVKDFVLLSDGESLLGDLFDLNFTNLEFADNVQADDLFSFSLPGESVLSNFQAVSLSAIALN